MINPESKVMHGLSAVTDLFALSIAFTLVCAPIVTVGPACSAMYHVMRERISESGGGGIKSFFTRFLKSFSDSFVPGLIRIVIIAALCFSIYISCDQNEGQLMGVVFTVAVVLLVFILASGITLYPQIAWFEGTTGRYIKNSVLLTFSSGLWPLLYSVIWSVPAVLIFFIPSAILQIGLTWAIIGFSGSFALSARIAMKIFKVDFKVKKQNED